MYAIFNYKSIVHLSTVSTNSCPNPTIATPISSALMAIEFYHIKLLNNKIISAIFNSKLIVHLFTLSSNSPVQPHYFHPYFDGTDGVQTKAEEEPCMPASSRLYVCLFQWLIDWCPEVQALTDCYAPLFSTSIARVIA